MTTTHQVDDHRLGHEAGEVPVGHRRPALRLEVVHGHRGAVVAAVLVHALPATVPEVVSGTGEPVDWDAIARGSMPGNIMISPPVVGSDIQGRFSRTWYTLAELGLKPVGRLIVTADGKGGSEHAS